MVDLVYLKLKNFEAINACMGLKEIEIDRTDSPNRIIMIKGANGSGKSTLLQELTPFNIENTLSRSSRRIPKNQEGSKEVKLIVDGRFLYHCILNYAPNKSSAYIKKYDLLLKDDNGIELNPNGNISTYEDVLNKELGLTKSFQKIGYLSPDLVNFVGMKAAERSSYISSIMPDISIFMKSYEIVTKKSNLKKREIDNLNKEIGKLTSINYETTIKNLKLKLDDLNNSIDKTKTNITKCEVYLNNLEKYKTLFDKLDVSKQQHDELYHKLQVEKNRLDLNIETISQYITQDGSKKLKEDIEKLNNSLLKNREIEHFLENEIEKLLYSIDNKTKNLDKNSIENETLEEILSKIQEYESDNIKYNDLLKSLEKENESNILIYDKMDINSVYDFSRISDYILDYINRLEYSDLLDLNILNQQIDDYSIKSDKINKEIDESNREIKEIDEKINTIKTNDEMNYLYSLKDNSCNTGCRIIKELEKYINLSNEKELLAKHKELLSNKLENLNKQKENITETVYRIGQNVKILVSINDFINSNKESISLFSDYLKDVFKKEIKDIVLEIKKLKLTFESYREYIHLKSKISNLVNIINELKIKKSNLITKADIAKEMNEYELKNNKLNEIRKCITDERELLSKLNSMNETKSKIEEDVKNYNKNLKKVEEFGNSLVNLATIRYYYKHLKDIYTNLHKDLALAEHERNSVEKERELLKTEFVNKQQLEKLRNDYLKSKSDCDLLANIWSPKTGFPSLLIEQYLSNLKEIINKDLSETWDDTLLIEDFIVTSNEFGILINRNGTIISDASLCSQAEKAILAVSISLSIIEMSLQERKYDVLRMDEVDAVLDAYRSRLFLKILNERLDRMQISSCFVISHRDNFEDIPADLIILKDGDIDNNFVNDSTKNIIFKYKG